MIQLGNVRLGLATNSSSSHSLIFMGNERVPDTEDTDFGWQFFTASSQESKTNYFGMMLYQALCAHMDDALAAKITQSVIGKNFDWKDGGYVDHQSRWGFPLNFQRQHPHMEFAEQALHWFTENNIVVLGGNDNTDQRHPLYRREKTFSFPLDGDSNEGKHYVARWDKRYKFWTLFNFDTGARLMMRFKEDGIDEHPVIDRASVPMLVDISITDYCPFGCTFCYRGSTVEGKHATWRDISDIAYRLAEMEVFEVALGGGEPTLHPDFLDILKAFHERNVVANFTTKNLKWLEDEQLARDYMAYAGSFAYSINDHTDIEKLCMLLDARHIGRERAKVHVVMGTVNREQLLTILATAYHEHIGVTLLGYKDDHRGVEHKTTHKFHDYSHWLITSLMALRDSHELPALAIDTPLAAQFEQELGSIGVPAWMFHTHEGRFSMFIDAVKMTAAKSSFGDGAVFSKDQLNSWDWIQESFNQISAEA